MANGDISVALQYFWPVLAFAIGIILSDIINIKRTFIKIHWRQISVFIEVIILIIVAFLPDTMNSIANMMTSFACGIQVESFRKIHGNSIATTMCIGNLRSGTYNLDHYLHSKDKSYLYKAFLYYGVILSFVMGAIIESRVILKAGSKAILLSPLLLMIALILMFFTLDSDDGDTYIEG